MRGTPAEVVFIFHSRFRVVRRVVSSVGGRVTSAYSAMEALDQLVESPWWRAGQAGGRVSLWLVVMVRVRVRAGWLLGCDGYIAQRWGRKLWWEEREDTM